MRSRCDRSGGSSRRVAQFVALLTSVLLIPAPAGAHDVADTAAAPPAVETDPQAEIPSESDITDDPAAEGSRRQRPRAEDSIWLPWWLGAPGIGEVAANADVFDTVSLFAYDERGCGDIASTAVMTDRWIIGRAQQAGVRIVATITATGLRPGQAIRCLGDPERRADAIGAVLAIVDANPAYAGIDLNFEHLALTTSPRQGERIREAYNAFVTQLCGRLDARDRDCIVTVMPRTSHRWTPWRGILMPAVYDYRTLGRAADRVRIMGYDQHVGEPGPIAGLPWIRRILRFAVDEIPPRRIELGIPTYGRVWSPDGVTTVSSASARALARRVGADVDLHPRQREATFTYVSGGQRHRVWFSSAAAIGIRRRLAHDLGIGGAAYWSAGMAEAGTWDAVRSATGAE